MQKSVRQWGATRAMHGCGSRVHPIQEIEFIRRLRRPGRRRRAIGHVAAAPERRAPPAARPACQCSARTAGGRCGGTGPGLGDGPRCGPARGRRERGAGELELEDPAHPSESARVWLGGGGGAGRGSAGRPRGSLMLPWHPSPMARAWHGTGSERGPGPGLCRDLRQVGAKAGGTDRAFP